MMNIGVLLVLLLQCLSSLIYIIHSCYIFVDSTDIPVAKLMSPKHLLQGAQSLEGNQEKPSPLGGQISRYQWMHQGMLVVLNDCYGEIGSPSEDWHENVQSSRASLHSFMYEIIDNVDRHHYHSFHSIDSTFIFFLGNDLMS